MKFVSILLMGLLLAACGQTSSESTPDVTIEPTEAGVNPDGSLDISIDESLGVSLTVDGPEQVSIPPGTVRYELQDTNDYFLKVEGEDPVILFEMTIGSGVEAMGEYAIEVCPSFLEDDYAGVCVNFIGMGATTQISDTIEGTATFENVGDTLSGSVDMTLSTPIDGDRIEFLIQGDFDEVALTE